MKKQFRIMIEQLKSQEVPATTTVLASAGDSGMTQSIAYNDGAFSGHFYNDTSEKKIYSGKTETKSDVDLFAFLLQKEIIMNLRNKLALFTRLLAGGASMNCLAQTHKVANVCGMATLLRALAIGLVLTLFQQPAVAQTGAPWAWLPADPNTVPGRYVGTVIAMYRNGGIKVGSGVLVGPSHVLTAGHCLFNKVLKDAGRPESEWKPIVVMFSPGQRGGRSAYGSANATNWMISGELLFNGDSKRDWGVIKLNRNLSTGPRGTGGWAQMAEWPNNWSGDISVRGYQYNANGSLAEPKMISFYAYNTIRESYFGGWHAFYSSYNAPDYVSSQGGGISGGPAFANNKVVGIFAGSKESWSENRLRGTRLSNWSLNEVRQFIARNP